MEILVTGGAGYIGSAATRALLKQHDVVVVDNLVKGRKELVDQKARFCQLDLVNGKRLRKLFREHNFDAVMHFAAYKAVGESMEFPAKYNDNIIGIINLAECAAEFGIKSFVFSSSAAVYGMPKQNPVTEETPTNPINYYGYTKLAGENILKWFSKIYPFNSVLLRYFNVAGDAGLNYVDPNAKNIFPILMEIATGKREKLVIFGDDYPTRDGTCIRDYIDINDLVRAHVLALECDKNHTINLGTSRGVSVKELVELTEKVTGKKIPREVGNRRQGDPAKLIASNKEAKEILGWEPEVEIEETIRKNYKAYLLQ